MRKSVALVAMLIAGPAAGQDIDEGRALFLNHCATCHGVEARGNGPMAPVLLIQPTNLTALAADNGGEFPTLRVVMRIDGREPLVSHGSPMPVFGPFFAGDRSVALKSPAGQPILVDAAVADLTAWIESVQE
ncbi:MAG TPA: cytochrome c [Paracoccaceae bacterium]